MMLSEKLQTREQDSRLQKIQPVGRCHLQALVGRVLVQPAIQFRRDRPPRSSLHCSGPGLLTILERKTEGPEPESWVPKTGPCCSEPVEGCWFWPRPPLKKRSMISAGFSCVWVCVAADRPRCPCWPRSSTKSSYDGHVRSRPHSNKRCPGLMDHGSEEDVAPAPLGGHGDPAGAVGCWKTKGLPYD